MASSSADINLQAPESWPLSLDALAATSQHHTLIFENDRVRVLQTLIPPGETTGMHTHRWPCVIQTLRASHYLRRDGQNVIRRDARRRPAGPGDFIRSPPMPPHSIENVGNSAIHLILSRKSKIHAVVKRPLQTVRNLLSFRRETMGGCMRRRRLIFIISLWAIVLVPACHAAD